MAVVSYSQLIFLLLLIICYTSEGNLNRHRRQIVDNTNRNAGAPQQQPGGAIPWNNVPLNPSNNPNIVISNDRNNQNQPGSNTHLLAASQPQIDPARSRGFYNNPSFQPPPFTGEKPSGWFGTNHVNWVSNQESELDKNKLATQKNAAPNNPPPNVNQLNREDGGPFFLQKLAKQIASKGDKAVNFGRFETRQGHGSLCSNHDSYDGYKFGTFSCPLPASTGMNQLNQFCCGPMNYQYCCNAQEFSQTQRGAFADNRLVSEQRFPKQSTYPTSTKKILAVILPIASFIVLAGIVILVFLYYKKFRKEQNRTRKPAGAIRLEDNYSVVPQELPIEKTISLQDEE